MPAFPGFIGSSYKTISSDFDSQRCVNLFLEKSESGTSMNSAMLVGTPGCNPYIELMGQSVRGMIAFSATVAYVVVGRFVHKIGPGGVLLATLGTIQNGNTPVSMSSNGVVIFFGTGPKGYVIDPSTDTLTEYLDISFTGADKVDFVNGSFTFNQPGTSKFWVMDPYSTTLNPLSFATAEGSPDALVSLLVDHKEIWLFGSQTTEVWGDTGDTTNFRFAPIDGAFIQEGCAALHSPAKIDNTVFWLTSGEDGQGQVVKAEGYRAVRVSDYALETAIAKYARIDDAVGFAYQQNGHAWYVLNFPTADRTWVLDVGVDRWHERGWRKPDGSLGRHRANCHMFFDRKHLVGDWESGKVYSLDLEYFTDDGNQIPRIRTAPFLIQERGRVAHSSLTVLMENGIGTLPGTPGEDPVCVLRWSDDGAHTWSNPVTRKIGKMGKHGWGVRFTRLGSSVNAHSRCYELTISDPVAVRIIGALINE